MISILGSLDIASLVPGGYRASTSLVLQTIAVAFGLFLLFKLVSFVRRRIQMEKVFGNLPGPKERHWLYGNFINFPKDGHSRLMKFIEWTNIHSNESGYFRIWGSLSNPFLVACHPSTVKTIIKTAEPKPMNVGSGYRMLKPWLGDGLLIAGGAKWARNRRLLTPAFHFDILKPYIEVYNSSADVLVNKFDGYASKGKQFELFQDICMCTLDVILRCAFSYDIDVQQKGENHPYVNAVKDMAITVTDRVRYPYLLSDFIFSLTSMGRKFKKDSDYVHSVAEEIMLKRKTTLEKTGNQKDKKYLDFLDILLTARDENGVGLTPLDIRNEVDTFLFEGHDTTASAISWILYSLAEHPEYQKKCQKEVDGILNGRGTDNLEWSDLPALEYLTMCIKEGMRLHSPVAMVGRRTTKELAFGDRVFPAETNISINIWAIHHNKSVWGDNHMEFVPDRFSKENIVKMDPYQFVPFSGGPRNCIGQHFAMNEEKVVIAKLLYNFTFKLVPGHVVRKRLAAVMRAESGIMLYAERRRH